jgi:hypothetical protein
MKGYMSFCLALNTETNERTVFITDVYMERYRAELALDNAVYKLKGAKGNSLENYHLIEVDIHD